MKIKIFAAMMALGAIVITGPIIATTSMNSVKIQELISESKLSPQALSKKLISEYPELAPTIVDLIISMYPVSVVEVTKIAFETAPEFVEDITRAAMLAMPSASSEIAQLARSANMSNNQITQAALAAGIDPTEVAELPASGSLPDVPVVAPPSIGTGSSDSDNGNGTPVSPN